MPKTEKNSSNQIIGLIKATRIHLSVLILSCIFLGVAIGYSITGSINTTGIVFALCIGIFSHVASSISNEWTNTGIDRSQDNGSFINSGSQSKSIVKRNLLAAGWITSSFITILLPVAAVLFFDVHWYVIIYTVIGLFLALNYNLPPFKFSRHGLGEVAALFAYSVPIIFGTIILQVEKRWMFFLIDSFKPYLLTYPPGIMMFTLITLFQVPDSETDKKAGKKSIAVLLGPDNAIVIAGFSGFLSAASLIGYWLLDIIQFTFAGPAAAITFITGIIILANFHTPEKPKQEMMKKLVPVFILTGFAAILCCILPGLSLFINPIYLF